jgi:ABC-type sugar transport system ATPase subunit
MILIKDIWKSFDQKEVLRGLSLQVPAGETLVIMCLSGCGKSLLLKMIAGLLCPERGEIFYNGQGLII